VRINREVINREVNDSNASGGDTPLKQWRRRRFDHLSVSLYGAQKLAVEKLADLHHSC
jgi:hypothetical protein